MASTKKKWVNHYEVMELKSTATPRDIKLAYRKLVLKWHPDKNPNDPTAATKFDNVQQSYKVLTDATKKAEFDSQVKAREIQFARDMAKTEKTRNMKKALEAAEQAAEEKARALAVARAQRKKSGGRVESSKIAGLRAEAQRMKEHFSRQATEAAKADARRRAVEAGVFSPTVDSPSTPRDTSKSQEVDNEVTGVTIKFKHKEQLSLAALRAKILEAISSSSSSFPSSGIGGRVASDSSIIKLAPSSKSRRKVHVFLDSMHSASKLIDRGVPGIPSISVTFTDKKKRKSATDATPAPDNGTGPQKRAASGKASDGNGNGSDDAGKRARSDGVTKADSDSKSNDLASMENDVFAMLQQQFGS